eukprot:PhF_6_TR39708/c0_g1_i5/m.59057
MDSWKNVAYAYARLNVPQPTDGGSVTVKSMCDAGGFSSTIFQVQVTTNENTVKSFVVKQAFQTETAKYHRLNRERQAAIELHKIDDVVLKCALCKYVFNETRPNDGEVDVVMEDLGELGGVQSGLYYGPRPPPNWKSDTVKGTAAFPVAIPTVIQSSFEAIAAVHGQYWGRLDTLKERYPFLHGHSWLFSVGINPPPEDAGSWEYTMGMATKPWATADKSWMDAELVKIIDRSLQDTTLEKYRAKMFSEVCTLQHGDFHPGNIFLVPGPATPKAVLIDWDTPRIGPGGTDLGQYMISHCDGDQRRASEGPALAHYYDCLLKALSRNGITQVPEFSTIQRQYVEYGFGRWLWLFPVVVGLCP